MMAARHIHTVIAKASKAGRATPFVPRAPVQNELPYLVEHTEYMRLLGANHIVGCDDRSSDKTTALQARDYFPSAGSSQIWYMPDQSWYSRSQLSADNGQISLEHILTTYCVPVT